MDTPFWPATPDSASPSPSAVDEDNMFLEKDLSQLLEHKINPQVVDYLVDRVSDAVDYGLGRPSGSAKQHARRSSIHSQERTKLVDFFSKVLRRAEVTMSVILGALIYIDRARPHLRIAIEEWAHHRVFLGALILASKYLNDSSLKNAHWAMCTGVFGRRDVARIEREFLEVLDFELAVHPRHLNREFWNFVDARIVATTTTSTASTVTSRRSLSSGLGALNLMEFGGVGAAPPPMVKVNVKGGAEKRKAMDMGGFGDDMDVDVLQRKLRVGGTEMPRQRGRRDALEMYAPSVANLAKSKPTNLAAAYRAPAPSPISPLSAMPIPHRQHHHPSPAYSSCSNDSCTGSCDSGSGSDDSDSDMDDSDMDSASPSDSSEADTPALLPGVNVNGNNNVSSLHFPLPHPLALRVGGGMPSSKLKLLNNTSTTSSSSSPLPIPIPTSVPPSLVLPIPIPMRTATRSLPTSREASPYGSVPVSRTASALALYPSCLASGGAQMKMIPPPPLVSSSGRIPRLVVPAGAF